MSERVMNQNEAFSASRRTRFRSELSWLGICLIGLASAGCVTRGSYDELMTERDTLRTDTETLRGELDSAEAERIALMGQLEASEERAVSMQAEFDGLVGELESEVALGQIEVEQVVNGIRLAVSDELLFTSGSVALNPAGRTLLEKVAQQIDSKEAIVSVEGHTDNVRISKKLASRYPTNWELAGARAAVVVRLLSENGVDPVALRAVSRGPFAPRATNDTPDGRARNRRTEILLRPIPKS